MKIPRDRPEGQRLEFTGRDALDNPEGIAAKVVSFLNSEGGDLYIGVREEDERPAGIEAIENVEQEVRRLRDFLVDKIEPSPGPDELVLSSGSDGGQGPVIRARIRPGRHRPYALKGEGLSRKFDVRMGARSRPMTREELAAAFSSARGGDDPVADARRALVADRDELQRSGEEWFWIGIQPARELALDGQLPSLRAYLSDPEAIGVLPGSPSFHVPFEPELRQGRLIARAIPGTVPGATLIKETVLRKDGSIRFRSVIEFLYRQGFRSLPRAIHPEVLGGVPLSLLRLAAAVLEGKLEREDLLVVDIALLGVGREEARLLPGQWQLPGPGREVAVFDEGDDLLLMEPLAFPFGEVAEVPERCVYRLLRAVYESFGLSEDAIPIAAYRPAAKPDIPA